MKKTTLTHRATRMLVLVIVATMLLSLFGCSSNKQTACTHNYYLADYADATASANGYKKFTCSNCGNSYQEVVPAKGEAAASDTKETEGADLTRKKSVNLFDLPVYSDKMGNVVSLSYCSERTDVDGWKHKNCYEICGSKNEEWVRYELNGKYSTIDGKLFRAGDGNGAGWLEFYDGDDFIAATPKVDKTTTSAEFVIDITGVEYLTVHFCASESGTWMIADQIMLIK